MKKQNSIPNKRHTRITALFLAAAVAASAALSSGLYYNNEAMEAYAEYEECDPMSMKETEIPETSDAIKIEGTRLTAYDFRESRTYGVAAVQTSGHVETIDFEAYAGIKLTVKKGYIAVEPYTHSSSFSQKCDITLYRVTSEGDKKLKSVKNAKAGKEKKLKGSFTDGLYKVTATFVDKNDVSVDVSGYLYADGKEIKTCRAEKNPVLSNVWNYILKDADPEDFLSNEDVTYPTSGVAGRCVHVKEWEDISDEIVLHDDWSDEMKVFAFVEYLSKNIAYDDYRREQFNGKTRASVAGDYTKDKYFTLGNNVGVCFDYTNILSIMCRHHGIPCTSVEDTEGIHTFNAVWLNEGWVGIDITDTNRYTCTSKDMSKENWKKHYFSYNSYGKYGTVDKTWTYDWNIWTEEKGTGQVTQTQSK